MGDVDQVPAPERLRLARPLGLLVLDEAELWCLGQPRVEVEFLDRAWVA
ncbi:MULTISPECIES: hypothetical protein [Kitasatospora]|nr:hypothetical protein [Kitasatospora sp. GP30]MDH6145742.1 beta-galactosidase/beta-glucuronidase [Kitasatospora sp. GP30]